MGVRRNFSNEDNVHILLILFRLLTMQCNGRSQNALPFLAPYFVVVEPQFSIFCQKCFLHFNYQKYAFSFHKLPDIHFRALSTNKS